MQFAGMKEKLSKITDAVHEAGNTCMIIVAGQLAGFGSDCLDKWFLTEENKSHSTKKSKRKTESSHESDKEARPEPVSMKSEKKEKGQSAPLKEEKAHELQEKLTSHVSTPNELVI